MKNLLIYINPSKCFGEEEKTAIKIQIDNSLDLGWKTEDIILATNFSYKYNGVKSRVVGDNNYCTFSPTVSKINTIIDLLSNPNTSQALRRMNDSHKNLPEGILRSKLRSSSFEQELIEKEEIYWFHDLDAFQLNDITESELGLDKADMFLPDYGRKPLWSTGSIFFKNSSRDIFNWIRDTAYKYKIDEESALWVLTGNDFPARSRLKWIKGYTFLDIPGIKNINERIKKANITYNFHSFNVRSNYAAALKPLRVAHFHFIKRTVNPLNPKPDQIDFFLRGINKIGVQIVPERLVKIFNKHGVK